MKKVILLIGCNGMLGSRFKKDMTNKYDFVGLDYPEIDITDKLKLEQKITAIDPEMIINCAAFTDVDGCETQKDKAFLVNAEGPGNLGAICMKRGSVLVHFSTDYVFDGNTSLPYAETSVPHPLSVYGQSKLKGEQALTKTGANCYIIRTAWLYGENGKNFVDTMLRKAAENKPLKVISDQLGSPTYTKDLAQAALNLAETGIFGLYHVTNHGVTSWFEFAKEIFKIRDLKVDLTSCHTKDYPLPATRPKKAVLSNNKASSVGIRMRPWREALADYLGKPISK